MPKRKPVAVPTAGAVEGASTVAGGGAAGNDAAGTEFGSLLGAPHDGQCCALNGRSAEQLAHSVIRVVIGEGPFTRDTDFDQARRGRTSRIA